MQTVDLKYNPALDSFWLYHRMALIATVGHFKYFFELHPPSLIAVIGQDALHCFLDVFKVPPRNGPMVYSAVDFVFQ
jgi:hypothetical protein